MHGRSLLPVQLNPNALHKLSPPSEHSLPLQFMTGVSMDASIAVESVEDAIIVDSHTKHGFSLSSLQLMPYSPQISVPPAPQEFPVHAGSSGNPSLSTHWIQGMSLVPVQLNPNDPHTSFPPSLHSLPVQRSSDTSILHCAVHPSPPSSFPSSHSSLAEIIPSPQ